MAGETENRDSTAGRILGAGIGIIAFGAVAVVSAPVAIPAIGIGLGAVGVSALTGTAIGFGLVGGSAVVGGVVGAFSPDIYEGIKGFFSDKEKKGEEKNPQKKGEEKDPFRVNPHVDSEEATRQEYIADDFAKAESPKQFLELVDHYRQSAIKKVVFGKENFDKKKERINKIFQATDFSYDELLYNQQSSKSVKNKMQALIIRDAENFPLEVVNSTKPPTQASFNEAELFKRIAYNREFIAKILDDKAQIDKTKHDALKHAYWQHEISGDDKQYPLTFNAQRVYMDKISKLPSSKLEEKIKKDVDDYLKNVRYHPTFYFPDTEVTMAYHQDSRTRKEAYHQDLRTRKIEADFDAVKTKKQFFELVDAYRQFAIDQVAKGDGTFDQKKNKINDIFKKTAFGYDRADTSNIILKRDSNTPASLDELKVSLKQKITKDLEFPVDLSKSPKQISPLTEDELLQRIIHNKHLISEILNLSGDEDQKQRALNSRLDNIARCQDENDLQTFLAAKNSLQKIFQDLKATEQIAESNATSFYLRANGPSSLSSQQQPAPMIISGMDSAFTRQPIEKPGALTTKRTQAFSVSLRGDKHLKESASTSSKQQRRQAFSVELSFASLGPEKAQENPATRGR